MSNWQDIYKRASSNIEEKDDESLKKLAKMVEIIISRRKELGLSQRDLAKRVGIKHSAIARFELCSVFPQINTVYKILKELDLELKVIKIDTTGKK